MTFGEEESKIRGTLQVAKHPLGGAHVGSRGTMEELTEMIDSEGNVWPSEGAILEGTNNVSIQ